MLFIFLPFSFCCYPIRERRRRRKNITSHTMFVLYVGRQYMPSIRVFTCLNKCYRVCILDGELSSLGLQSFVFSFSLQIIISLPCRVTETYVIAFWSSFAPFLIHNLINFGTFWRARIERKRKCVRLELLAFAALIWSLKCFIQIVMNPYHAWWAPWCSDRM